jgi:hypothetical protein
MRMRILAGALCLLVLVAAGCGGSDKKSVITGNTPPNTDASTPDGAVGLFVKAVAKDDWSGACGLVDAAGTKDLQTKLGGTQDCAALLGAKGSKLKDQIKDAKTGLAKESTASGKHVALVQSDKGAFLATVGATGWAVSCVPPGCEGLAK